MTEKIFLNIQQLKKGQQQNSSGCNQALADPYAHHRNPPAFNAEPASNTCITLKRASYVAGYRQAIHNIAEICHDGVERNRRIDKEKHRLTGANCEKYVSSNR